jgi:hypothetical protein
VRFPVPEAQMVQTPAANDGHRDQVMPSNLIDISVLPVSTARLLKQLLVSIAGKEMGRDEA